ncbi:NADH-dependent [FeFe] hydrogenase, group A6 [Anaeromicropila herbilytica]|uniref:NADH:ubiquinone oxidoreductase n=1 Tax=Anaeromicropila herbilytica TaxID=2785025 RepID=A0A7R7IDX1_9FIRM|nr:NADH-dependent [FeFe] hydrogenase, group A6 [Anaeromicropila herbilytica]BCN31401.1 NADH:ubiquinone oxidoreductase [Anaeromicropila herbilytica]
MENVNVTIDGRSVSVPKTSTILEAAKQLGINIPTLCYMHLETTDFTCKPATCRVCVVEVEGRRNLCPACATPVMDNMVIKTNSMRALEARKAIVELMISDHPQDCLTCNKSTDCRLQELANELGIRRIHLSGTSKSVHPLMKGIAIERDMSKCIMCRRCEEMCNKVQKVGALSGVNRGFEAYVATAFEEELENTVCVGCGQCVAVCPTGALMETDDTAKVIRALKDPNKTVVFQTAPATRVAIGEEFGLEPGTIVTNKMVTALKRLGADYVFDTNFSADLTIMEEGTELIGRLTDYIENKKADLPILTSCCPGWINFMETQYPDQLHLPSTAKSPQGMFGAVAKNYFAEKLDIDRENMVVVSIMPCTAKKLEAVRDSLRVKDNPDVDYVLTTREAARLIKMANIDFNSLEDSNYDDPLGEGTGAAVIFGVTGGVLEAALRTVYETLEKKELKKLEFVPLRGFQGVKKATVTIAGIEVNAAVVHGLGNARTIMEEIKNGNKENLHVVEVMACPGGCIGGGGQPYLHGDDTILEKRTKAIYEIDHSERIRKSHENEAIQELYKNYYQEPNSELAHRDLHTHFKKQEKY